MATARHVLVVEDDAATRTAMTLVLEGAGYRVTSVAHGGKALDYLEGGGLPNLILLDLMMPVMDGWEFRARQLDSPRLAAIPVVVISAAGNVPEHAASLGVAGCLQKPVEFAQLLETIQHHCAG